MWDQPIKCAKFIDKFTAHKLKDSTDFNLHEFTRKDLEGIIHLLHGFYTQFVSENLNFQKKIHCNYNEVLYAMSLAEVLYFNKSGELCVEEETWKKVKNNPHTTRILLQLSQIHEK